MATPAVASKVTEVKAVPQPKAEPVVVPKALEEPVPADIFVSYKTDSEYGQMFKGPETYPGEHQEIAKAIRGLNVVEPQLNKVEVRKAIQQAMSTCN